MQNIDNSKSAFRDVGVGKVQRNVLILMEWYEHGIRRGIGRWAGEQGWHLTVNDSALLPHGWQGDGVILVAHRREDMVDYVRKLHVPVVDLGIYRMDMAFPRVTGDHALIGRMAAQHFCERGYRHAAWFSTEFSSIHQLRATAYTLRFSKAFVVPKMWVWSETGRGPLDSWRRLRDWLSDELKHMPKPLAVFAFNDYDAAKVLDTCRYGGWRVPEDVAVLGVDNNELVCCNQPVPISSIRHDLDRIGYEGAALLARCMDGLPPPVDPILIPPRGIEERQSTSWMAVSDPIVRAMLVYLRENLHKSFGMDEMADALKVPRYTMDRRFRKYMQRSVYAELLRLRVACVRELLLQTDLKIVDIAAQTGFCHAQHLNNTFRRFEGISPLRWRRDIITHDRKS